MATFPAGAGKSVLAYVYTSCISVILTQLVGHPSFILSRNLDVMESSSHFSIVIPETNGPHVLRKHCARSSLNCFVKFVEAALILEAVSIT